MFRKYFALILSALLACLALSTAAAYESTTLRHGMRGEEVRELQQGLIDLGYLGGTADGIFGNKTENAVRQFQKKNKLSVDGLAGKKTRNLIASQASGSSSSSASSSSSSSSSSKSSSSGKTSSSASGKSSSSGSSHP